MTKQDLEIGGEFYEVKLEMESICKEAGFEDFIVEPFDVYQGPMCVIGEYGSFFMIDRFTVIYQWDFKSDPLEIPSVLMYVIKEAIDKAQVKDSNFREQLTRTIKEYL